jgi:hypothetical protein
MFSAYKVPPDVGLQKRAIFPLKLKVCLGIDPRPLVLHSAELTIQPFTTNQGNVSLSCNPFVKPQEKRKSLWTGFQSVLDIDLSYI